MGTNKKTIKTHAKYSATQPKSTNHQDDFFSQINTEITKHDNTTDYKVSNDMLIPYINKLGKSGADNTRLSDKQLEIIKSILSDNRILLYFDQYLNIHNQITNSKPNKNNLKIINEKDLSTHFFELPILMDIFRQLGKPSEFTINNITARYYQAVWQKIMPIQRQIKMEYEKMSGMESRLLFIHGVETNNMFIVPDDVIICKLVSYNYTGAYNYSFLSELKKVISYYKNNNILNSSCCTKDGAISIYFPNQLCNDTNFGIYKFEIHYLKLAKNYMGLFSINEKNKLVKHKLSNYDLKNIFMKRIKLSNLILDKEVKNKILIIFCCRNQDIGTIALYTEFNYRLERLQLLLSRTFCNCSNLDQKQYKLPLDLGKLFNWYKKYEKDIPFIWHHDSKYLTFYDTYLSTDISTTHPKPNTKNYSLTLNDVIKNPDILKLVAWYNRPMLFVNLYKSYSDDTDTTPQIIDALTILLLYMINNSYNPRYFKISANAQILNKSLFFNRLLDTLYANNTLNITKCSRLLLVVLEQLNIFLLQSFKFQQNYPSTTPSRAPSKSKKHTLKQLNPDSNHKPNPQTKTHTKKYNPESLVKGSARLSIGKKDTNLLEFTIKLLDLYYKLSTRFGYKIKQTIIKNIRQDDFKLLLEQLIIKPKHVISTRASTKTNPDEITRMIDYLSKLCKGCLNIQ